MKISRWPRTPSDAKERHLKAIGSYLFQIGEILERAFPPPKDELFKRMTELVENAECLCPFGNCQCTECLKLPRCERCSVLDKIRR